MPAMRDLRCGLNQPVSSFSRPEEGWRRRPVRKPLALTV
jgi:hypothetical protein